MKMHSFISSSRLKKIFCVVFVTISIFCSIIFTTYMLSESASYQIRSGLYDANDCEVLFLGTSHMYNGIFPMELYRDYGISSFNIAVSGERMAMTYYSLLDALRAQNEIKVVVIDMHALEYGNQKNDPEMPKRCHVTFDAMQWSRIKYNGIRDCVDEGLWPEFFFPLYIYHERWMELTEFDFLKRGSPTELARGGRYYVAVANSSAPELIDINEYKYEEDFSTEYLQKILDVCSQKDIQVLMIYIPFPASIKAQKLANRAVELAKRNDNAEYINFLYDAQDMELNYATDTADTTSHLNPLGARKFTKYLGDYLKENYNMKDYRGDKEWEKNYNSYLNDCKDKYFPETADLYQYLMLCADEDYRCEFSSEGGSLWDEDKLVQNLFDSIDTYGNMVVKKESFPEDLVYYASDTKEKGIPILKIDVYHSNDRELVDTAVWDATGRRLVTSCQ